MTFAHSIRVYWEDTDAGGIVFYANYLKFLDRARTEWLRHVGLGQQTLRDEVGGMFVVTGVDLRYFRPARLDDVLKVTCVMAAAGRASMTIAQQVFLMPASCDDAPQLLCEGSVRIGWVDSGTLRPARLPATILEHVSLAAIEDNAITHVHLIEPPPQPQAALVD